MQIEEREVWFVEKLSRSRARQGRLTSLVVGVYASGGRVQQGRKANTDLLLCAHGGHLPATVCLTWRGCLGGTVLHHSASPLLNVTSPVKGTDKHWWQANNWPRVEACKLTMARCTAPNGVQIDKHDFSMNGTAKRDKIT